MHINFIAQNILNITRQYLFNKDAACIEIHCSVYAVAMDTCTSSNTALTCFCAAFVSLCLNAVSYLQKPDSYFYYRNYL